MKAPFKFSQPIRTSPLLIADAYKISHWDQYEEGTALIYSNFTPRKSRGLGMDRFLFVGLQPFLDQLQQDFSRNFFGIPMTEALGDFIRGYKDFFKAIPPKSITDKVEALWKLGFLPLEIRSIAEGETVHHNVPVLVIFNTIPEFYWLTNWVETYMSAELWGPSTSATTAMYYRSIFDHYAELTSDASFMPAFQGHDFSMRGLWGKKAAEKSGMGHLVSFNGTDTLPAVSFIQEHYVTEADSLIGTSIPATEHSVMCAGSQEEELETYRRLLTQVYPTGFVSVVSDTWDFWKVVTEYLPQLKDTIMNRDGKLVIRPDSSPKTPVEIIVGDPFATPGSPEYKGLIECLWDTFGGVINSKGYKELDSHIGAIYGDSITLQYQIEILEELKRKGFSSTNIVLGIGSTYGLAA